MTTEQALELTDKSRWIAWLCFIGACVTALTNNPDWTWFWWAGLVFSVGGFLAAIGVSTWQSVKEMMA